MLNPDDRYLLDTHALIFWQQKNHISAEFIQKLDEFALAGSLFVSAISFWEIGLLVNKGRIKIPDVYQWKEALLAKSGIRLLDVTADEMVASTQLPMHHKDPFDRILIAHANQHQMVLVSKDYWIAKYDIKHLWID